MNRFLPCTEKKPNREGSAPHSSLIREETLLRETCPSDSFAVTVHTQHLKKKTLECLYHGLQVSVI